MPEFLDVRIAPERNFTTLTVYLDYDIPGFYDVQVDQYSDETRWRYLLGTTTIAVEEGEGFGTKTVSVSIDFPAGEGVLETTLEFSAMNTWGGVSTGGFWHIANAALAQGDKLMIGGNQADILVSGYGADELRGDDGDDHLDAGEGDDLLYGGGGDDVLHGGAGADIFDGGLGSDRLDYNASAAGIFVNLTTGEVSGGDAQGDSFAGIEGVIGSDNADVIFGDGNANALIGGAGTDILIGGAGDDRVDGGAGDDLVRGGSGADTLLGGQGNDRLDYNRSLAGVTVNLNTGTASGGDAQGDRFNGFEGINGTAYADTLTGDFSNRNALAGGMGADILTGGRYDDLINGGAGSDTIDGSMGIDTLSYVGATAGVQVYLDNGTASGPNGDVDSFTNIENLLGSDFGDTLAGNDGRNRLNGRDGDDFIDGKGGADLLYGGAGDDIFYYGSLSGSDIIMDFVAGDNKDHIEVSLGSAFDTFTEIMAAATMQDNSTVFNFGAVGTLTLSGVDKAFLTTADFVFV